jgi:hypothetical protein
VESRRGEGGGIVIERRIMVDGDDLVSEFVNMCLPFYLFTPSLEFRTIARLAAQVRFSSISHPLPTVFSQMNSQ